MDVAYEHDERLRRCRRCRLIYKEIDNTGKWSCAYHPKGLNYMAGRHHPMFTHECCGGKEGSRGCVPCDHDDFAHPPVDNIHLLQLSEATQNRIWNRQVERRPGLDFHDPATENDPILWRCNVAARDARLSRGTFDQVTIGIMDDDDPHSKPTLLTLKFNHDNQDLCATLPWFKIPLRTPQDLMERRQRERGCFSYTPLHTRTPIACRSMSALTSVIEKHKNHLGSPHVNYVTFKKGAARRISVCFKVEKDDNSRVSCVQQRFTDTMTFPLDIYLEPADMQCVLLHALFHTCRRFGFEWVASVTEVHVKDMNKVDKVEVDKYFEKDDALEDYALKGLPKVILDLVSKNDRANRCDITFKPVERALVKEDQLSEILQRLEVFEAQ